MSELTSLHGKRLFSAYLPESGETNQDTTFKVPHLVFRSYDAGRDQEVHIEATVPVSTEAKIGMKFCPWCGSKLG